VSDSTSKPRVRINTQGLVTGVNGRTFTGDSFQNFKANLGYGTGNISSGGTYGFFPLSRNHTQLEWMYRGSWIVRKIVDVVADDMTRAKIQVTSDEDPSELAKLDQFWTHTRIWQRLNQTVKWARLYGGCIAVLMIDGQKMDTPLQLDSIGKGQFKGLLVLDRWMVNPDYSELVTDLGVDFGTPVFYNSVADATLIKNMKIHHSRCIRIEGIELPYFQKIAENGWGLSVIEPMFDRLIAYDSTTTGAAQLVYKAHLRTYYVENLRGIIADGGQSYQALLQQVNMIRLMQTNEGMSLFDSTDRFEAHQYSFAGLAEMLVQFGQQLGGAADIPLTRIFGQAPSGLNSTGEGDEKNYENMINAQQEARLRPGIDLLRSVTYRSRLGKAPPDGETYKFAPISQLSEQEKAQVATTIVGAASAAFQDQILTRAAAMKEVKQWSEVTGFGSNITDKDIEAATDEDPPTLNELVGERLDNPIDAIRAQHGLLATGAGEGAVAPGEEQVTGGTDSAGVIDVHGLTVVVETPKGSARRGPGWSVSMPADYGYISGTSSAEGPDEQMDCYVGPDVASPWALIIHQVDPATEEFDEHKVMLGFNSASAARQAYCRAFSDGTGWARIGKTEIMTIDELKEWLDGWRYGVPGAVGSEDEMAGACDDD
jgi:uncharacterized protein